jgi:hypothetical protein
MTHSEKALDGFWSEEALKELAKAQARQHMCTHHEFARKGTPVCLGKPVYQSNGDGFCEEHAPIYMEDDLRQARELLEIVKEGLLRMGANSRSTKKKNPRLPRLKKLFGKAEAFVSAYDAE